jgi:hypothetical protein
MADSSRLTMATTLTQLRPLSISTPPPADNISSIPRRDSTSNNRRTSFISTSPEQRLVRRSSNRSSWSSAPNTSPVDVPSPSSDTSSGAAAPRKFRLPVRVSTQPSFGTTSDSSPQARRRSLSLSSDPPKTDNKAASDSKRRTRNLYLSQLDEDKAEELRKSPRPSPRVASPPPPPYEKGPASTETLKVSDKAKDSSPKPADAPNKPAQPPVAAAPPPRSPKSPRKQPPAPSTTNNGTTPAPKPATSTTITQTPQKMSSAGSSP